MKARLEVVEISVMGSIQYYNTHGTKLYIQFAKEYQVYVATMSTTAFVPCLTKRKEDDEPDYV